MLLASNISSGHNDWLRGSSEDRDKPSHSFQLTKVNLAPSGLEITLSFLSRDTTAQYHGDITQAVDIPPDTQIHGHRMEGTRGTQCGDLTQR